MGIPQPARPTPLSPSEMAWAEEVQTILTNTENRLQGLLTHAGPTGPAEVPGPTNTRAELLWEKRAEIGATVNRLYDIVESLTKKILG